MVGNTFEWNLLRPEATMVSAHEREQIVEHRDATRSFGSVTLRNFFLRGLPHGLLPGVVFSCQVASDQLRTDPCLIGRKVDLVQTLDIVAALF